MENVTCLFLAGEGVDPASLRTLAGISRTRSIHLSVLVAGLLPQVPSYSYAVGPYGTVEIPAEWHSLVEGTTRTLTKAADEIGKVLSEEGVDADVQALCAERWALRHAISRRALSSDLVVISDALRVEKEMFGAAVQACVFGSPTGVVLNGAEAKAWTAPRRVFVAWSYGAPASRAVRAALPVLRQAEEVCLAIFDPDMSDFADGENPGSDVARWLTHQGCRVNVQQFPSGGLEIGEVIQQRAFELGADLVVMGAYDHSRARQIVFGGTTQTMIAQTGIPVLLAH